MCKNIMKSVNVELGVEMIKMKLAFAASVGQRIILSPRRKSNPWPSRYQLGALTIELRENLDYKQIRLPGVISERFEFKVLKNQDQR